MADYVVEFGKDGRPVEPDGRLDAAAFHRNHDAIWSVLSGFLKGCRGDVLEAGSGTGQHVVAFAQAAREIQWWPSDANEAHLRSIAAWRAKAGLANVHAPMRLDLSSPSWPDDARAQGGPEQVCAVFCANVIHIAPWAVAEGLLAGAARLLQPGGRLFLYGPFKRDGRHTALSNAVFDTSLRNGDPAWGVRDLEEVARTASAHGLSLGDVIEMPANNLIVVLARRETV